MKLNLKRTRKFALQIKTACKSEKWTTNLDGKWQGVGEDKVELVFRDVGSGDEPIEVLLSACADGEGDCLTWTMEDLAFVLKPLVKAAKKK